MLGEMLGQYRIIEMIGQGGMGVVYGAEHPLIGRRVAAKLLRPELSQNPEIVRRFFNEARATTLIHHPGIVDVIDFGYHRSGRAYIVMERLEGESLAARLSRDGHVLVDFAVACLRQLANALGAAHRQGIVHRDLKPDNVFIVGDADVIGGFRAKILDFGIAKLLEHAGNSVQTRTGSVMGTPRYMSPEQCRDAGDIDQRSDIYSLGCMAFEMLTGRPPFLCEGMGDWIIAHVQTPPEPPRTLNPAIPLHLDGVILRMLAKKPDDRPQTMEEVVALLDERALPSAARRPRRGLRLLAGVAALGAVGLGVYAATRPSEKAAAPPVVVAAPAADAAAPPIVVAPPPPAPVVVPLPPPPVAAVPDAAPAAVRVRIRSEPPGAEVFRAGERLGTTPLDRELPPGSGASEYVLKLADHEDAAFKLRNDRSQERSVTLVAVKRERPPPPPKKPPPKKPIKDGTVDPFAD